MFKETFTAIRDYSHKNTIDRDVMELVKEISAFLATRFTYVSTVHSAACELTDAMLTHCFCGDRKDTLSSKGTWCFVNDEIEVDFNDAAEELFRCSIEIEKLTDIGVW